MLVTVYKPYHVPQASEITTSGTIFTEIYFHMSNEWVRTWSHVFLTTKVKKLAKKAFGNPSRKSDEKEKKKKKLEWQLESFLR